MQDARSNPGTWRATASSHALEVQAEVVGEIRTDAATLDRLVGESQGAVGNLQAIQAGNQLTALAAKQSMQLQSTACFFGARRGARTRRRTRRA